MRTITRWRGRHLAASFFLHLVALALATLFFTRSPELEPIEVSIVVETGDSIAGSAAGRAGSVAAQSEQQEAGPDASQAEPTQQATQPVAPRPRPKPAAPRKAAPRPSAPEQPAAVEQQASPQPSAPPSKGAIDSAVAADGGTASGGSAGSQSASGSSGPDRVSGGGRAGRGASDYLERVRAALAKHKRYPEQARKLKQEGTARIALVLARDGTVLDAQIAAGSGFPLLDEATLQMARDASPVPRVPDEVEGDSVRIALPVTFALGFFARF